MFETPITVVGNIITNPERRWVGDQELFKFRVASNARRRTPDGNWETSNSLYVTVNCWGRLVTGVGAALGKGDAVIVVGNVHTSEYDDREGNRRSSLEIRATSVGPDLARCIVRIERRRHPEAATADHEAATADADTAGSVGAAAGSADAAVAGGGWAGAGREISDGEPELDDEGLPLTA